MSNLKENIQLVDELIRELAKINSKLENGHVIHAWRDNRRVLAKLQQIKEEVIKEATNEE